MLLDKDRRGIPYHLEASSGWTKEPEWRSVLRRNKVVLMLTASSISDYSDDDKSSLQQKVADTAGVDKSLVTIDITAGSVTITATIAGPASTATSVPTRQGILQHVKQRAALPDRVRLARRATGSKARSCVMEFISQARACI